MPNLAAAPTRIGKEKSDAAHSGSRDQGRVQWGTEAPNHQQAHRRDGLDAAATTPVQRMGVVFARVTHPCQPSPIPLSGRPAHRPFRGLLSVYSRCGLHTRTVTVCRDRYPKASDTSSPPCLLRSLPAGAVAGWGLHPLEKRRLVTAHVGSGRWVSCASKPSAVSVPEIKKSINFLAPCEFNGPHLPRLTR